MSYSVLSLAAWGSSKSASSSSMLCRARVSNAAFLSLALRFIDCFDLEDCVTASLYLEGVSRLGEPLSVRSGKRAISLFLDLLLVILWSTDLVCISYPCTAGSETSSCLALSCRVAKPVFFSIRFYFLLAFESSSGSFGSSST